MTDAELVHASLRRYPAGLTLDQLAGDTGLPRRSCEAAVQELALSGVPIASGSHGVRLARTADELAVSNRGLHHRLREQYRRLRAQQQAERRLRAAEGRDLTLWST